MDTMGKDFKDWWIEFGIFGSKKRHVQKAFEAGWIAGRKSTEPSEKFMCIVDGTEDALPSCVMDLDYDGGGADDCVEAKHLMKQGKTKRDCPYWKQLAIN